MRIRATGGERNTGVLRLRLRMTAKNKQRQVQKQIPPLRYGMTKSWRCGMTKRRAGIYIYWMGGSGPRPSLMRARESGTILVCQPLSDCSFCIAAMLCASHVPVGEPER